MTHRPGAIVAAGMLLVAAASGTSAEEGAAHLGAVRALAKAVAAKDRAAFEAAFAEEVLGMQPWELWTGARDLVTQYGAIEDVSLGSVEDGGAYLTVKLTHAVREVFVELDEEERIRRLIYEP